MPDLQGVTALEYDGVIEMIMPDIECLANARNDPFYTEKVQPEEEKFIETSQIAYMVGWCETYIHNGRVVGGGDDHYYSGTNTPRGDEGLGAENHEAR